MVLRVDLADVVVLEFHEPQIVLRNRNRCRRSYASAGRLDLLHRIEGLVFPGREIDAVDFLVAGVVGPDLAVDAVGQAQHVELGDIIALVPSASDRTSNFSVLGSNFAIAPWNIMPNQMLPALSVSRSERADREALLQLGQRDFRVLTGLRIEAAEELLAEIRVPDHATAIENDVMRLDGRARQIVFGDQSPWWLGRWGAAAS